MGLAICCIRRHGVLCLLSALLLLSSTQVKYSAEGRSLHKLKLVELAKENGEEKVMMRAMIGSRPPTCEKRCYTCGRCEAVQVPIAPQDRGRVGHFFKALTSWSDSSSNYKPINWKCKCGDMIFNP